MDNLAFNRNDLYNEVAELARAEGALSREAWNGIVETMLANKSEFQEMDDDADFAQLQADLKAKFSDFEQGIGVM